MNTTLRTFAVHSTWFLSVTGCSQGPGPAEQTGAGSEALSSSSLRAGAVFTQTNAAERNELVAYARDAEGKLTPAGRFDTGGAGLGTGLSAQGAIAREGRWLFLVNAGSNDVSTFDLAAESPKLVSHTPSSGVQPVSVTARGGLVYVLNAGGTGNIAGFRVDAHGMLTPIATAPLSAANVTPTEVAFAPDGDTLVVTEKATNLIDTYRVGGDGRATGPTVNESDGPAPFGFDFSPVGEIVVAEAMQSAASAYALRDEVQLTSISASVPNGQSAACWLVVAPDGSHAFTANAGNGTLSSYRIGRGGDLTLEIGAAGTTGATSHTVDMAFAAFGRYLYALANVGGTITTFRVEGGELTPMGNVDSLPASATGLVAW